MLEHMQFSNGEEIIDAYEYGERFDLVFMDVEMGETDGIQSGQIIDKYYKFRKFELDTNGKMYYNFIYHI